MERQDTQPVFDSPEDFNQFLADNPDLNISLLNSGFESSSFGEVTTEINNADDKQQQQQQIRMIQGQQFKTGSVFNAELITPSMNDVFCPTQVHATSSSVLVSSS